MKLYFNGCSHTYGDDLDHPEKDAWPVLVANHYNAEFLNDAMSGGTNDRIVNRTLKFLHDYDKFYIAWANTARFTRHCSDNFGTINFNPHLVHGQYGEHERFKTYGELHYKYWHDDLYSFKLWLQQVILLQSVFRNNNKDYKMIVSERVDFKMLKNIVQNRDITQYTNYVLDDDQINEELSEIETLFSQIDLSKFIDWNTWYLCKFRKDVKLGKTLHYLEDGHKLVAEHIILKE